MTRRQGPGFDYPDYQELLAIARHPLTQQLNRELLALFDRIGEQQNASLR